MLSKRYFTVRMQRLLVEIKQKNFANCLKLSIVAFLFFVVFGLGVIKVIQYNNDPIMIKQNFIYFEPVNSFFRRSKNLDAIKIDWHDYKFIEEESQRVGPGEQGKPVDEVEPDEEELNKLLFDENGYYGLISDKISVNRSIGDLRHPGCKRLTYLKELPTVSIVIPFYNDHFSTLLRTVHSVINRSPAKLLKEVILVNDRSTKDFLYGPLKRYISENLKNKVMLLELPVRSGLIWARLAGARAASGDVLIFLDSHTEASTNWLPPLLEPIAKDYRTCVCPFIDVIEFKTYEYVAQDEGSRGVFDWNFFYRKLELKPNHQKFPTDLFESPVMAGGLFAISTKFFWELGGYDTGLDIWGGEQYELSFKIWLCGGQMFDAPCSRVGHIYRGSMPFEDDRKGVDFLSINYKRVAEVWMDDYKEFLYARDPAKFQNIETGDLSYQLSVKKRNKCKPFKHFIENVAPDLLERYPLVEPPPFANGAIQSVAAPHLCIDTYGRDENNEFGLYSCADDKKNPQSSQFFSLRHSRDIECKGTMFCFDINESGILQSAICHSGQGNQYFRYDLSTQQIFHSSKRQNACIDHNPDNPDSFAVFIANCDDNSETQRWKWGNVNETAIANWVKYGTEIIDQGEIKDLS